MFSFNRCDLFESRHAAPHPDDKVAEEPFDVISPDENALPLEFRDEILFAEPVLRRRVL